MKLNDNARSWLMALMLTAAVCAGASCATRRTDIKFPTGPGDWTAVANTAAGAQVRLDLVGAATEKGELARIDATHVVIVAGGETKPFPRDVMRRIFVRSERKGAAKQGFLVGFGVGALQGYALTRSNRVLLAALFGAGWGALGAGVGAIRGIGEDETLVYFRNQSDRPNP